MIERERERAREITKESDTHTQIHTDGIYTYTQDTHIHTQKIYAHARIAASPRCALAMRKRRRAMTCNKRD